VSDLIDFLVFDDCEERLTVDFYEDGKATFTMTTAGVDGEDLEVSLDTFSVIKLVQLLTAEGTGIKWGKLIISCADSGDAAS
jgi:hypothetical protein